MAVGRFAPSPTADLHLGNLRTGVVAWLLARSSGSGFLLRVEDLDPASQNTDHEERQLRDLAALGLDWDGPIVHQSERFDLYHEAIGHLVDAGHTFECYCTRREIRDATLAAHGDVPRYPGTCRDLAPKERRERRDSGRPAAIRLRSDGRAVMFDDRILGHHSDVVDDVVIRRNDGTPAYNLAVVVDDAEQGIEEVVRGDDLAPSTPAQLHLRDLLGLGPVMHAHVPLVYGPSGDRLAKRDGAVTMADLAAHGVDATDIVGRIGVSLGLVTAGEAVATARDLLDRFDATAVTWKPWHLNGPDIFAEQIPS